MTPEVRARVKLTNPIHFLALGLGSGLAKVMPGTVGTLASLPFVILSLLYLDLPSYIALTLLISVAGIMICAKTADDMRVHDDSSIVWDEFAGMFVTLLAVPLNGYTLILGFILFRFFDIVKPWPISVIDKNVHGGLGIMLDDIVAGLASCACLHGILLLGWLPI